MLDASSSEQVAKPPTVKKSLFNKPSWSKTQPTGDAVDIFRRSEQTYADIVAEEEKKRNRRRARKERDRAKQIVDGLEPAGKRRRISDGSEDEGGDSGDSVSDTGSTALNSNSKTASTPPESATSIHLQSKVDREDSPKSLLKRYESAITTEKVIQEQTAQPLHIIDIESEDEPGEGLPGDLHSGSLPAIAPKFNQDEELYTSDEEFPELARKAREKAKISHLENEKQTSAGSGTPFWLQGSNVQDRQPIPPISPIPPREPVIEILITSQIANTKPLIVSRRLTQRLKDVRITWCQRQGFDSEATAAIFLTWKGKRLFDVTTCRSLGIGVDASGKVALEGEKDVLGEENRQIHMEAMTDEILEAYKKARSELGPGKVESKDEGITELPKQPVGTKIILRSKDYEEFKLIVKPVCSACSCLRKAPLTRATVNFHIKDRQCF